MRKYDKYQLTKTPWIGEIPSDWTTQKLKYVSNRVQTGSTPPSNEDQYYSEEVSWFTPADFDGNLCLSDSRRKLSLSSITDGIVKVIPANSVLMVGIGATLGKVGYIIKEATSNQQINAITFDSLQQAKYFAYFFHVNQDHISALANSATLAILNQSQTRDLLLPVPPPEEQTAIANYLDEKTAQIDTLIEKKQELIELLKEERKAIINEAVSGEGKNWERKKLKYIARLKSGNAITADDIRHEGNYPVYGGNGLRGYTSQFTHEGEHILIGRQGALCGNINYAKGKFFASEHAVVVDILDGSRLFWLGELLRNMNLNQYSIASAQPGLSVERIQNLAISSPTLQEQDDIVHHIQRESSKIDKAIDTIQMEIELMQEYKTALISEVVTGKVKVI